MKSPLEMNSHFNILQNVGPNENYITKFTLPLGNLLCKKELL
jgi:hypothetical protein